MAELISSTRNPKIKQLLALQEKSKLRRELGLFVVEGVREIERCVKAGFELDSLFICPEIAGAHTVASGQMLKDLPEVPGRSAVYTAASGQMLKDSKIFEVPKEIYAKIAYRESTEGIIAEVRIKDLVLQELKLSPSPLIVVLESVEKPGNIGAVLRSADAAGADAVIVCDPLTDLYNPNLIRASLGARFSVQCSACTSSEAISWLKSRGIRILTAQLQDSFWYYNTDMKSGTAIVIGTESSGLSDSWRNAADAHIKIPMLGSVDSLNASVSAAILLFEAVRQRESV